jgi:hypothetical protein
VAVSTETAVGDPVVAPGAPAAYTMPVHAKNTTAATTAPSDLARIDVFMREVFPRFR